MRACMVAYSFYESDSRIIQYARALVRRGDSVDVIALSHDGAPRFEIIDGVHLYRIQERSINERARIAYLLRILRFLFTAMWVLTWKHLRRRYDVVHVHSVPDFLVMAALPLRLAGVPVILDIHDILPEFYASKFNALPTSKLYKALLLVERWSAKAASHVIIANPLWYDRFIRRAAPQTKCSLIGNYPDPEVFHAYEKQERGGRFLLMYPGSLNWHQGVDIAVRAFAEALPELEEAEFQIYGEGPARKELEALVRELGLEDRISVQNYLPTSEIAKRMASADLAVVPKRSSSSFGTEAASTKVQEFMAVGVPVIVSRTKIDSYLFDPSMVRFVPSEDVSALASSIVFLYSHPDERRRLVEAANRHIRKNNWDVKQHEYLALIDSLLGRASTSFVSHPARS